MLQEQGRWGSLIHQGSLLSLMNTRMPAAFPKNWHLSGIRKGCMGISIQKAKPLFLLNINQGRTFPKEWQVCKTVKGNGASLIKKGIRFLPLNMITLAILVRA
ncbi:hypothetical protein D3C73_1241300 [compost metagenome]